MEYKVGDIVRIKSLDWYNENKSPSGLVERFGSIHFVTEGMSKYCGKLAKINKNSGSYYRLDIDDGYWGWESWMFEDDDIYKIPIKSLCSKSCYMECNENCPLFEFKELL